MSEDTPASPGESTGLAEAEKHLRFLAGDAGHAFAFSYIGRSMVAVLAELDRLREQRDAVLALLREAEAESCLCCVEISPVAIRQAMGVTE